MNFSTKGVARKYKYITQSFSVLNDIFDLTIPPSPNLSLKAKLQELSTEEHNYDTTECIFGWNVAYQQIWTHIIIRIKPNWDPSIPEERRQYVKQNWETGIENNWSNIWAASIFSEAKCSFTFDIKWVNSNEHRNSYVTPGTDQGNVNDWESGWDPPEMQWIAAHEFGHMIGLPDEYEDSRCPDRDPVNTGTVMDDWYSYVIPSRMMQELVDNIGSEVVSI